MRGDFDGRSLRQFLEASEVAGDFGGRGACDCFFDHIDSIAGSCNLRKLCISGEPHGHATRDFRREIGEG